MAPIRQRFDVRLFAEQVSQYPMLFDSTSSYYKNIPMKENCWAAIGAQFGITAQVAYQKWRNLRDRYNRERKRYFERLQNGEEEKACFPRWFMYKMIGDLLERTHEDVAIPPSIFLDNRESGTNPGQQTNGEGTCTLENPDMDDLDGPAPSSPSSVSSASREFVRKRRRTDMDKQIVLSLASVKSCLDTMLQQPTRERSETELFLLSLAPRMEQLPPRKKAYVRLQMETLLYNTECET